MTTDTNGDNGRTHEPSLRELTAELDGLRDLSEAALSALREIIDERDRLYKERDDARKTAVDAALAAAKEAVSAALLAADRAVAKVESANEKRFESVNEFRGQLADQATTFLPRAEANIRFESLTEKVETNRTVRDTSDEQMRKEIQGLRETRSHTLGIDDTRRDQQTQTNWSVGQIISAIFSSAALVAVIIEIIARRP